jgi:hypothetical protein
MSHDPESIRRLTRRYRYLRGLEQIPLALVVLGTWTADVFGLRWSPVVFVVLLALAIPAMRAIGRYYDRRFGVVKAPGWGGGTWTLILVAFFALQVASNFWALPVQLGFLAAGLGLAVYALRNFTLERQRLLLAAFFVVISVWPPISDPSEGNVLWRSVFAFGFPAVWILMGVWDHRALMKAFGKASLADTQQMSFGGR